MFLVKGFDTFLFDLFDFFYFRTNERKSAIVLFISPVP